MYASFLYQKKCINPFIVLSMWYRCIKSTAIDFSCCAFPFNCCRPGVFLGVMDIKQQKQRDALPSSSSLAAYTSDQFFPIPRSRDSDPSPTSLKVSILAGRGRSVNARCERTFASRDGAVRLDVPTMIAHLAVFFFFLVLVFVLIATPDVVRLAFLQHAEDGFDDHAEPNHAQQLEHQKQSQEYPFHTLIKAYCSFLVEEWFGVSPCAQLVRVRFQHSSNAGITTIIHYAGNVPIDGPAKGDVYSVAREEPCSQEDDEHCRAGNFILKVFEHFRSLACVQHYDLVM